VEACEEHSMAAVCEELGLHGGRLKAKVTEFGKEEKAGSFVTVALPAADRTADPVAEWIRADGAKLRVWIPTKELGSMVTEFLGGRA
jgi:hypothetical protein